MKQPWMNNCKDCKYWLTNSKYRLGSACWCCRNNKFTGATYYCRYSKPVERK